MKNKYLNFWDDDIPYEKRKKACIEWLVKKGKDYYEAELSADKILNIKKKEGLLVLIDTWGQHLSLSDKEIYMRFNPSEYKKLKHIYIDFVSDGEYENILKYCVDNGWDIENLVYPR